MKRAVLIAGSLLLLALAPVSESLWEDLGGSYAEKIGDTQYGGQLGGDYPPMVAVDRAGNPVVAWTHYDFFLEGRLKPYLLKWNPSASAWEEVGKGSASGYGLCFSTEGANLVALRVDSADRIVVAMHAWADVEHFSFIRWDGSSWSPLGDPLNAGWYAYPSPTSSTSVALDRAGNPAIAWCDPTDGGRVMRLKRWNGSAWEGIGGSETANGISGTVPGLAVLSLALDPSDNPVLAWGTHGATDGGGQWTAGGIYLRRWSAESEAWEELVDVVSGAGSGSGDGIARYVPDLALPLGPFVALDHDGLPMLSWVRRDSSWTEPGAVFLSRWNGSTWTELGGSCSAGGISNLPGNRWIRSLAPLVVDSFDQPVVAWDFAPMFGASEGYEVHLSAWNGAAWVDLGGSASSGGLDRLAQGRNRQPISPFVALDRGAPVVAWTRTPTVWNDSADTGEAQLLRWNPSPPAPDTLQQSRPPLSAFAPVPPGTVVTGLPRAMSFGVGLMIEAGVNSLRAEVEVAPNGAAFAGIPTAVGPFVASGSVGELTIDPLAFPNGSYRWQARITDDTGRSSRWVSFDPSPGPDFVLDLPNHAPPLPRNLGQFRMDGITAINAGASTDQGGIIIKAELGSDEDYDSVRLEVELRPIGEGFTGDATTVSAFGPAGMHQAIFKPLTSPDGYHWQAWTRDSSGSTSHPISGRLAFGGNSESLADVSRSGNAAPLDVLSAAVVIHDRSVTLRGTVADPDLDLCRIEVEVRRADEPFDGRITATGNEVDSGERSEVSFSGGDGEYHWQARAIDAMGRSGRFISIGAFTIGSSGSGGMRSCLSSGHGAGGGISLLLAAVLLAMLLHRQS